MKEEDVLHPTNGIFNPLYRFAFTNITKEDLESFWNGRPLKVKAGETVKLTHHLAVKLTKELVDRIMITDVKLNEVNFYKNNPNTAPNMYRAPSSLGVPAARKIWEDKIIKQLPTEKDEIQLEIMRSEMIEGLTQDLNRQTSTEPVSVPAATLSHSDNPTKLPEVFAEINR